MAANRLFGNLAFIVAGCVSFILILSYLSTRRQDFRRSALSQTWEDNLPSPPALPKKGVPSQAPELQMPTSPEPHASLPVQPQFTPNPSRCGVTKVSMLYGAHKFSQLEDALDGHRRHSERWGCGFQQLDNDVTTRKLYSKHYFLLSTMVQELAKSENQRQEWLMWIDADSILINPALSPEIFLPPSKLDSVYALVTADHNGLNDGIFYLRVHSSSLDLLTQVAAYPLTHPDEDLGWFGEQAAMANVVKSIEAQSKARGKFSGIAWLPRTWMNAYEFEHGFEGEPGNMLVHFAGLAETRIDHMQKWLDELDRNQAKWEIGPEQIFYKDDIAKFWEEVAANNTKSS